MSRKAWISARAVSLAACAAIAGVTGMDLLAMEAGGGSLTGPLAYFCLGGSALFLLATLLTIGRRPAASILAGLATLCCLPLYFYLLVPKSLAWLSSASSSVSLPGGLVFNPDATLGVLLLAVMAAVQFLSHRRTGASLPARGE